jgi:MFS family permease
VFVRDESTVLSYAVFAAYAFCLYAFGPAVALLRSELRFSYTMVSAYSALWAAGATLVGVSFGWVSRRIDRSVVLWCSVLGTVVGATLFATAHSVALTLAAAGIIGFAGTMAQTAIQAVLSDRHGIRRDRALIEANVGAGACAVAAPLALGFFQGTPAGWRAGMTLPVLALAIVYLRYRRAPLPSAPVRSGPDGQRARLSIVYWLLALAVAAGMGVEVCVAYFGVELLTTTARLSTTVAAAAMSLFYLGILVGRIIGSRLAHRPGRALSLVWASLALTMIGILLFWLPGIAALALAGLLITGLGVANLFPLSLALALTAAPGRTDDANARTQLLGGLLTMVAPVLLGALSDRLSLPTAFTVSPALVVVLALLLLASQRISHLKGGARDTPVG